MRHTLFLLVLLHLPASLQAEEQTAAKFDAIFGDQVKSVKLTRETDDDVALARKILDWLEALGEDATLQHYAILQAAQLAAEAGEAEVVLSAVERAREIGGPDEHAATRLKILETCYERARGDARKQAAKAYLAELIQTAEADTEAGRIDEAGDRLGTARRLARYADPKREQDVTDLYRRLTDLRRKYQKADMLANRLAGDPSNAPLRRELITYCIIELDQPKRAADYADENLDEIYRQNVLNLNKPFDKLDSPALESLATWLQQVILPQTEADAQRARMLQLTVEAWQQFIAGGKADDPAVVRAKLELDALQAQLARLEGGALAAKAALLMTFDKTTVKQKGGKVAVRDLSTNGNHGLGGGVTLGKGVAGECAVFDGRGKIIIANDASLQITGDQTIAMWLKPTAFGARRNPLNKSYGGECTWTLEESGSITYYYGSAGKNDKPYQAIGSGRIPAGQWTHVAVVRDTHAGGVRWFVNGKPRKPVKMTVKPSASKDPLLLGDGYVDPYIGGMDEVVIFPSALSAADVASLYRLGKSGNSLNRAGD